MAKSKMVPVAEQPRPLAPAEAPPAPAGAPLTSWRVTLRHSPLHRSVKSLVVKAADAAAAKATWLREVEAKLSDTEEHRKVLDEFRSWARTPEGAAALAAVEVQPAAVAEEAKTAAQVTLTEGIKGQQAKVAVAKMAEAAR